MRDNGRPGHAASSDAGSRGSRTRSSRVLASRREIPRGSRRSQSVRADEDRRGPARRRCERGHPSGRLVIREGLRLARELSYNAFGNDDPGRSRSFESDTHGATLVDVEGWLNLIRTAQGPNRSLYREFVAFSGIKTHDLRGLRLRSPESARTARRFWAPGVYAASRSAWTCNAFPPYSPRSGPDIFERARRQARHRKPTL